LVAGVLKDKARLLVTNQLQYVPQANTVVFLDEGEAVSGTYDEIVLNPRFAALLHEYEVRQFWLSNRIDHPFLCVCMAIVTSLEYGNCLRSHGRVGLACPREWHPYEGRQFWHCSHVGQPFQVMAE